MTTHILTQGAVSAARAEVGDRLEVHLVEETQDGCRWEVSSLPGFLSRIAPGQRPQDGESLRVIGFLASGDGAGELVLRLHRQGHDAPLRTSRWRVEVRHGRGSSVA